MTAHPPRCHNTYKCTRQHFTLQHFLAPSCVFFVVLLLQRLATRALRAADREAVRDKDDYALACYGCTFNWLTPTQKEVHVLLHVVKINCRLGDVVSSSSWHLPKVLISCKDGNKCLSDPHFCLKFVSSRLGRVPTW